jgi:hypothetical protein
MTDTQQRFGGFELGGGPGVRRTGAAVSAAGLAALVAAGLWAAAPASAQPGGGATFTHSAESGEFRGGRLILHGVGRRVTSKTNDGRTEAIPVKLLHTRLFQAGKPATGRLRRRGGDKAAFRLSQPRYSAAKQTVSYRAKPLNKMRVGALRQFGTASLSIVGHPRVMGGATSGQDCLTTVGNHTDWNWPVVAASKWDTDDDWDQDPNNHVLSPGVGDNPISWESNGGYLRGCGNTVTLQVVSNDASNGAQVQFVKSLSWNYPLAGSSSTDTCTGANSLFNQYYSCYQQADGTWEIYPN